MLQKIIYFIKYNNVAVIILAVILVLGGAAFAAGPEAIGQKQTSVQGLDNTALLAADLDKFSLDFKIENIEQDEKYYYATYSYLDLVVLDKAWQYQLNSKTQKISKKIKEDIGQYLAKFLAKYHEARVRQLKQEKNLAAAEGAERRVEVTEYGGLVGRTLDLAAKVFPGYEPVKKRELPAPENFNLPEDSSGALLNSGADNLTKIYNNYVATHPEIFTASSTPADLTAPAPADTIMASSSPDSAAMPPADMAIPETSAVTEPASVNVIELPATPAGESAVPVENATPNSGN